RPDARVRAPGVHTGRAGRGALEDDVRPRAPVQHGHLLEVVAGRGKVYVLGQYSPGPAGKLYAHFLYRFDLHGRPDRTFGDHGRLLVGAPGRAVAVDQVALQPDGRILVV